MARSTCCHVDAWSDIQRLLIKECAAVDALSIELSSMYDLGWDCNAAATLCKLRAHNRKTMPWAHGKLASLALKNMVVLHGCGLDYSNGCLGWLQQKAPGASAANRDQTPASDPETECSKVPSPNPCNCASNGGACGGKPPCHTACCARLELK
jgi:hypothetical protein